MLEHSQFKLDMHAMPHDNDLHGRERPGCYFYYTLTWDSRVWAHGTADSPAALGRSIGEAVRSIAECTNATFPGLPIIAP